MLNVVITPTAEALLQRLMIVKDGDPALLIEQALQYFCDRQFADLDVDTTVGFSAENKEDIVVENEQRWAQFQADGVTRTQGDVADRFERLIESSGL
jgi:5'-3' exonuclease